MADSYPTMIGSRVYRGGQQGSIEYLSSDDSKRAGMEGVRWKRDVRPAAAGRERCRLSRYDGEAVSWQRGCDEFERTSSNAAAAWFFAWMTAVEEHHPRASTRESIRGP